MDLIIEKCKLIIKLINFNLMRSNYNKNLLFIKNNLALLIKIKNDYFILFLQNIYCIKLCIITCNMIFNYCLKTDSKGVQIYKN